MRGKKRERKKERLKKMKCREVNEIDILKWSRFSLTPLVPSLAPKDPSAGVLENRKCESRAKKRKEGNEKLQMEKRAFGCRCLSQVLKKENKQKVNKQTENRENREKWTPTTISTVEKKNEKKQLFAWSFIMKIGWKSKSKWQRTPPHQTKRKRERERQREKLRNRKCWTNQKWNLHK